MDGVYDKDPVTNPDAQRYAALEYDQVRDQLNVLDSTAVSLCMENDLPIVVFDVNQLTTSRDGRPGAGRDAHLAADGAHGPAGGVRALPSRSWRRDQRWRGPSRPWSATSGIRTGRGRPRLWSLSTSSTTARLHRSTSSPATFRSRTRWSSSPGPRGPGAIEKAIPKSDVGLTPNVDGTVVRLNIPPLTEDRRKDLVRVVHSGRRRLASRSATTVATRRRAAKKAERTATWAPTRATATSRSRR